MYTNLLKWSLLGSNIRSDMSVKMVTIINRLTSYRLYTNGVQWTGTGPAKLAGKVTILEISIYTINNKFTTYVLRLRTLYSMIFLSKFCFLCKCFLKF